MEPLVRDGSSVQSALVTPGRSSQVEQTTSDRHNAEMHNVEKKASDVHSQPRSRFQPGQGTSLRLGERDARLLTDLYLHGVMARHQIQALYFGSVPRCNARLRQLFDGHFVTRQFLPAAPFGSEAVYALGLAGIPVVASRLTADGLEADTATIRQQCRQGLSPALLEHTLAIVEFFIAARQAVADQKVVNDKIETIEDDTKDDTTETHTIEIERWLPELLCRHEYDIRQRSQNSGYADMERSGIGKAERWQREVFKPDGFLRLRQSGVSRHECQNRSYFLEIDRGHVSSEKFLGKLRSHRRYLESGLFTEVYGEGDFRTLVVTTSQKRLDNLQRLVQDAGENLFWLTTFEAISVQGLLSSIWQVPGCAEQRALL